MGMSLGNLSGLTALVTGGSRGIGLATATLLQAQGATVMVHGSTPANVEKAAAELGVKGIVADLFAEDSVAHIAAEAGPVDILVNNAGITRDGLFARQTQQQWDEVQLVNVSRVVALTRALLPHMASNGFGRIVNLTSVVAHMSNVGQTNYITAKSALTGFTKALAKEVARKGVTVNAVAPGFINTDMTAPIPEQLKEQFMKQIPAQRFGEPTEIAAAVAFLVSREAGYVTGTTLHVNGGMYV
jgi:3-oxoacyl-[acyl-carrier protein] reductase